VDSGQWTVDSGQWTVDSGHWTVDSGQVPRGLRGDGIEKKGRDGSRGRVGQVERFPKRPEEAGFHKIECYSPSL
jgi:hypothetical protein